jgi:hypothetical protein
MIFTCVQRFYMFTQKIGGNFKVFIMKSFNSFYLYIFVQVPLDSRDTGSNPAEVLDF